MIFQGGGKNGDIPGEVETIVIFQARWKQRLYSRLGGNNGDYPGEVETRVIFQARWK